MSLSLGNYTSNTSSSTSITINKPADVVEGELMVATITGNGDSAPVIATPSGWTVLERGGLPSGDSDIVTFYKIATDSEPANYTFTMSTVTSQHMVGIIVQIIGGVSCYATSEKYNSSSTTVTGTTITPSYADSLILFISFCDGTGTFSGHSIPTDNPTWNAITSITDSSGINLNYTYAIRSETTATGAPTATLSVSRENGVHMIAVKPSFELTLTDSLSGITDSKLVDLEIILSDEFSISDESSSEKTNPFNNTTKPSTTWTNTNK